MEESEDEEEIRDDLSDINFQDMSPNEYLYAVVCDEYENYRSYTNNEASR